MGYRLLLVEDDAQVREIILDYFRSKAGDQISIVTAADGDTGMEKILDEEFDLVMLDIMLPGTNGFELCREIRRDSTCPIIFLTAKSREQDLLYGYDLGCDDYMTKPFSVAELYVKVNALLKRSNGLILGDELKCGNIILNPAAYKILVDHTEIKLPPKEYMILKYLMEHKGQLVTRDDLLTRVWGYDFEGTPRVVDNHVKKLRHALGSAGNCIKTIIAMGYKLEEVQ